MKIVFKTPHLSIEQFQPIEIPNFVVLTWTNWSWKSHLLEAIVNKKVVIEGLENWKIVYFNYENFRLENETTFNAQQISAERENAWNYFQKNIKPNISSYKNSNLSTSYVALKEISKEKNKSLWFITDTEINNPSFYNELLTYKQNINDFFWSSNYRDNQQAQAIFTLIKDIDFSVDEIRQEDFLSLYRPFYFKSDFLPQQLGKVIWDYYVRLRDNEFNDFENKTHGKSYPVLSEEEFIKKYWEKPWDIINNILHKFDNLEYRVNSPEWLDIRYNFQLKLQHTKKNLEIDFGHLSSGERVLMALVASVYKSLSDNHFPDILLLDEIDASLHPSMIKNLLEVIRDVFLSYNIKIILVTHSPTTVAIAEEDSIFIMHRSGENRIEKKNRNEALEILTEWFVTLEEGIKVFDQVAKTNISIITEWKNNSLIKKALELFWINNVDIISGVEDRSGTSQLKTLFDFFTKVSHEKKVIFIWDCDAISYKSLKEENNTIPIVLDKNLGNKIALTWIENIFPETLFNEFKKTIKLADGKEIVEFDPSQKRNFEKYILERNNKEDFANFQNLIERIKSL